MVQILWFKGGYRYLRNAGASGGGSINIFGFQIINNGDITANGGNGSGSGGKGSITLTEI